MTVTIPIPLTCAGVKGYDAHVDTGIKVGERVILPRDNTSVSPDQCRRFCNKDDGCRGFVSIDGECKMKMFELTEHPNACTYMKEETSHEQVHHAGGPTRAPSCGDRSNRHECMSSGECLWFWGFHGHPGKCTDIPASDVTQLVPKGDHDAFPLEPGEHFEMIIPKDKCDGCWWDVGQCRSCGEHPHLNKQSCSAHKGTWTRHGSLTCNTDDHPSGMVSETDIACQTNADCPTAQGLYCCGSVCANMCNVTQVPRVGDPRICDAQTNFEKCSRAPSACQWNWDCETNGVQGDRSGRCIAYNPGIGAHDRYFEPQCAKDDHPGRGDPLMILVPINKENDDVE